MLIIISWPNIIFLKYGKKENVITQSHYYDLCLKEGWFPGWKCCLIGGKLDKDYSLTLWARHLRKLEEGCKMWVILFLYDRIQNIHKILEYGINGTERGGERHANFHTRSAPTHPIYLFFYFFKFYNYIKINKFHKRLKYYNFL